MRSTLRQQFPSLPWHTSYLTVAALSFGLLVGLSHVFPRLLESIEPVLAGLIVGAFTVTSLLHWYDVTTDRSPEMRR